MVQANGVPTGTGATLQSIALDEDNWNTKNDANITGINQELSNLENVSEMFDYRWADAAAMSAETTMRKGDTGYRVDTDTVYRYLSGAWVVLLQRNQDWTPAPSLDSGTFYAGDGATYTSKFSIVDYHFDLQFRLVFGANPTTPTGKMTLALPITVKNLVTGRGHIRGYSGARAQNVVALRPRTYDPTHVQVDMLGVNSDGLLAGVNFNWAAQSGDVMAFDLAGQLNY